MLSPVCEQPPNYYSCSYCSAPRTLNQTSLRCDRCKNWVHAHCVASIPFAASASLVPFVMNYRFLCKCCVKLRDRTKKRKGRPSSKHSTKNEPSPPLFPPSSADDTRNTPETQLKEGSLAGEGNDTWEMYKDEKDLDDGAETFVRVTAGWKEICITAFANLLIADHLQEHPNADLTYEGIRRQPIRPRFYNKKDHVVPFVDSHWRALCTDRTRTATWWATIGSCLYSAKDLFIVRDEKARSANSEFGLVDGCLWDIGPGLIQSNSKTSQTTRSPKEQKSGLKSEPKSTPSTAASSAATSPSGTKQIMRMSTPSPVLPPPLPSSSVPSTTCAKSPLSPISVPAPKPSPPTVTKFIPPPPPSTRQTRTRSDRSKKPRNSNITSSASPNTSSVLHSSSVFPTTTSVTAAEHPFNRDGYRYTPCEPDPHLTDLAYRVREAPPSRDFGVHLPREDRSPALHVSKDGMAAMAEGGFRAARANCGVKEGNWYFEVFVDRGGEPKVCGYDGAHVRVGWARREASLLGPVGFDGYSYAYRDTTGDVVHCSRLSPYGASFGTGDVIGCSISLPQESPEQKEQPHRQLTSERRNRIPIRYKGQNYYESKEYAPTQQMTDIALAPPPTRSTCSIPSEKSAHTTDFPTSSSASEDTTISPTSRPSSRATTKSAHVNPSPPPPPTLGPNSFIEFYKNGVPQGKAFTDIYDPIPRPEYDTPRPNVVGMPAQDDGTLGYYPAVSCYRGGRVTVNFGPNFKYPPPHISTNTTTTTTTSTSHPTNLKRPREEDFRDEEDDDFPMSPNSPPVSLPEPKRLRTASSSDATEPLLDIAKNRDSRPCRPMSDRWTERMVEETVMDVVDELELFFGE